MVSGDNNVSIMMLVSTEYHEYVQHCERRAQYNCKIAEDKCQLISNIIIAPTIGLELT